MHTQHIFITLTICFTIELISLLSWSHCIPLLVLSEYLAVFITQGATTEAQQDLKDALFVTQVKALPVTHAFLQHM